MSTRRPLSRRPTPGSSRLLRGVGTRHVDAGADAHAAIEAPQLPSVPFMFMPFICMPLMAHVAHHVAHAQALRRDRAPAPRRRARRAAPACRARSLSDPSIARKSCTRVVVRLDDDVVRFGGADAEFVDRNRLDVLSVRRDDLHRRPGMRTSKNVIDEPLMKRSRTFSPRENAAVQFAPASRRS